MKREDVLKEMKEMVGKKDPIEFFGKMVDMFGLLFDRLDELELELKQASLKSALAIQWEPKVASSLITSVIDELREDKETYFNEISLLKKAFQEDKVTQNYADFCAFWQETLGWHPFLDYK